MADACSACTTSPHRYWDEYSHKLNFIWPYLQLEQRKRHQQWALHRLCSHGTIRWLVYLLGAVYMLGIATVVGWVGQQAMRASKDILLLKAPLDGP